MDSWTPKQLKCMQLGGNNGLSEFLASYDLMSEPMDVRYQTKAAEYYRKKLRAFWNDEEFNEEKPDYEEGRNAIEYRVRSKEELKEVFGPGARSDEQNPNLDKAKAVINDFWSGTKSVASNGWEFTKSGVAKVDNKLEETGVKEKVSTGARTVGTKTVEYSGKAYNATKEGIVKIATNEKVQEISSKAYNGAKDVGNSVWGFFSKALNQGRDNPAPEGSHGGSSAPSHAPSTDQ